MFTCDGFVDRKIGGLFFLSPKFLLLQFMGKMSDLIAIAIFFSFVRNLSLLFRCFWKIIWKFDFVVVILLSYSYIMDIC